MSARVLAPMILAAIGLAACSAPADQVVVETTAVPTALTKYCVGTLSVEVQLMDRSGADGWVGDGSLRAAPGSAFLLALTNGERVEFEGYAFDASGAPHRLVSDSTTGLVRDRHFTTDCDLQYALERRRKVVLVPATVYASRDLTGTPCRLAAGTEFTDLVVIGGGSASKSFMSSELGPLCGFETGHSADVLFPSLIPR